MHAPPFCPSSACQNHWPDIPRPANWYVCDGHYRTRRGGRVRRYRCKSCGRGFSESTFSLDYYAKKRVNLYRLRNLLTNGSSMRAAARQLHVSTGAITRRVMLLARQALATHAWLSKDLVPHEPFVADGFQSFWVSQYHPNHFNLLAGADSQYLFAMTQATLRRFGTMTEKQKRKRARIEALDPTDPHELVRTFGSLMEHAAVYWEKMESADRVLRTDEHPVYPGAVGQVTGGTVTHLRYSSTLPRTPDNPLFAVNYLDREIRKDLAEHHRESVCFARSAVVSTARMWIYLMDHNYYKRYRLAPPSPITHAEAAGVNSRELRRRRRMWLTRRAFLSRTPLTHTQRRVWMGMLCTPERENRSNRRLTPGYCAA